MGLLNSITDNFKSGSFEIDNSMSITDLTKQFKSAFGCSLRIYKGKAIADGRMTMRTLNEKTSLEINKNAGKMKIRATEKVGDVEEKFLHHFGVKVQIADKHNGKLVPNEITLGEASRL
jgi:hypothetical protein